MSGANFRQIVVNSKIPWDTFACRFYQRIRRLSPCDNYLPILPVILPVPRITFTRIQTTDPTDVSQWMDDDDFSPRLGERAKIQVSLEHLPAGFNATLRIDIGRLSNRENNPATADVNESFTLVSRVETAVNGDGTDPLPVEVEWDGMATVDVAQEFSARQTANTNTGASVNIPLNSIASGDPVIHGLYVVDRISLRQGSRELAMLRPADIGLSVPIPANFIFNANWPTDLRAFGLTPFRNQIEEALRRFGGRDYMVRNATLANRMNVRFVTNAGITNRQSMRMTIGGSSPDDFFGSTPLGPAPLDMNIYVFNEAINADISIFPSTFMLFNNTGIGANDVVTFRNIFSPLGVTAARTRAAPGTATPRAVAGGVVTGACTAEDADNITLTLDNDGIASVVTTDEAIVPVARATQIQAALRAFVRMVGNTTNHELGHALGLVSRNRPANQITINGTTVTRPLNGDNTGHNTAPSPGNILDAGRQRTYVRRIEATGVANAFNADNTQYFRDCIPYDERDD